MKRARYAERPIETRNVYGCVVVDLVAPGERHPWRANIKDHPAQWEAGRTEAEAIGKLLISFPHLLESELAVERWAMRAQRLGTSRRGPLEQMAYVEGMIHAALKMKISTLGSCDGNVRRAYGRTMRVALMLRQTVLNQYKGIPWEETP